MNQPPAARRTVVTDPRRSPLRRLLAAALAAGLAAEAVLPAAAQDAPIPLPPPPEAAPGERTVTFSSPKEGFTLLELLEGVNAQTDRSVLYDSNIKVKIEKTKVQFIGNYTVPKSRMFDWLQGVLSFASFILIPIGPADHEQWMVVDVTNPAIRSRPTYVKEEELDAWKDRDGVYIVSTLRVKNLDSADLQRARTGLQQLLTTTATIGRINEVPGQSAFVIADFAPVVYASKKLLEAMDVPLQSKKQVLKRKQILYALASDMEAMLNDLLTGTGINGQPRRPANPQQPTEKPDPQIIADNRTNSLILYAIPEDIEDIEKLIDQLDTEYRGKSRLHFRTLKYQEAEDVQGLLEDLISGTASSSSRTGTSRSSSSSRSRTQPQPGQPAPAPFGTSPNEGDPVIIADVKNNSLIIHATEDQYADLSSLIDKLDRPRKQVLIETSLVELTVGDNLDVGIDLFGVQDDIAVDTNGDGVVDTFTDERKFFGTSFYGNSTIVNESVNGVDIPVGVAPLIGRGLTAGIFNNGRIPFILSAVQERNPTKVLTMPSIVTSDNQSATIKTTEQIPYLTTTFVGPDSTPTQSYDEVTVESNLTISPSISADDFLRLNISQQVSSAGNAPSGQRPPTNTRSVETELMVPNAATVVLGGIISSQEVESRTGIPVLMDIPGIGFLFQDTSKRLQRTNLFLFVTPTIMHDLTNFSDYHRISWEKKMQSDKLFGEEVKLLGTNFLGPDAPRSAVDAVLRIDSSGGLDAYRYAEEPGEKERVDAARSAWEEMERRRAAEKAAAPAGEPAPPASGPAPAGEPGPR